jgi:hypothetical protein
MVRNTTQQDLCDAVCQEVRLSRAEAKALIAQILLKPRQATAPAVSAHLAAPINTDPKAPARGSTSRPLSEKPVSAMRTTSGPRGSIRGKQDGWVCLPPDELHDAVRALE